VNTNTILLVVVVVLLVGGGVWWYQSYGPGSQMEENGGLEVNIGTE
jgi:hypothetical protein